MDTIGIIGYGFVGRAVAHGMKHAFDVLVYDKATGWTVFENGEAIVDPEVYRNHPLVGDARGACATMVKLVNGPIFVCVPTPMKADGSCDTNIVEGVMEDLNWATMRQNEVSWVPIRQSVVLKSTVPPGTTKRLDDASKWLDICFNPEFLTEANSYDDFKNQKRIILGGGQFATRKAGTMYSEAFPDVIRHRTSATVAEMVKLVTNCFLASKVSLANEFKMLCDAMDLSYNEVMAYAKQDGRLGESHWNVPGPDGKRGFGGSCVPPYIMVELKEKGKVPISECSEGLRILSCDGGCEKLNWKRIKEVSVRMFNGELVHFETEFGTFCCTPEHLMPVIRDGVLRITRADEVDGADSLVRPNALGDDQMPTLWDGGGSSLQEAIQEVL